MARLPNQDTISGIPAKPRSLSPAEGREWDRIIQELTDSGVRLSKVHRALVEQAATIAVDINKASKLIEQSTPYILNRKTGVVQLHPAARRKDSLRRDYTKVLSALGMRSIKPAEPQRAQALSHLLREGIGSKC